VVKMSVVILCIVPTCSLVSELWSEPHVEDGDNTFL
jgi:hypothetical protein